MKLDLSGPGIGAMKARAHALRASGKVPGITNHAQALEHVAHERGARDWNTLVARLRKPVQLAPGTRVSGQYLGQAFAGHVHALALMGEDGPLRVTVQFDAPVDVVSFDSFSSFRSRVTAVIGTDGRSLLSRSGGEPHLLLEEASP